jgi:hypothetical protein
MIDELYGEVKSATAEESDRVLSSIIREFTYSDPDTLKWTVVDGSIQPEWLESMNSFLDDKKVLCIPNNACADGLPGM